MVLSDSLRDWRSEAFAATLKAELEGLRREQLPLTRATRHGGQVDACDLAITVLSSREQHACIHAHVGVFFSEIVAGCSCGDDPFTQQVYCELTVEIDKATAVATVTLDGD